MGIESDQLVYDYLSRVGDLAQQQQLSSGTRMRLVSALRGEIDRQRVKQSADSPAAVRRIIGRLGSPDELVAAAAASPDGAPSLPGAPPDEAPAPAGRADGIPAPRRAEPGASAPHRAGTDELGSSEEGPEWWSVAPGRFGDFGEFGSRSDVPGFTGGVEIPEVLKPPRPDEPDEEPDGSPDADEPAAEDAPEEPDAPAVRRRRRLPRLRRRRPQEDAPGRGFAHPVLLLAALLLAAGAVLQGIQGLVALAAGWGLAYITRTLSKSQSNWAVMGLPGVVAAAALVWLWGRLNRHWGAPIAEGAMGPALGDTAPWALRAAALASAAYLLMRSRGPRGS
ncbi:hypothetical protein [Streptomyces sp. NPDC057682]|uniref:hypothetical protein n=1 Tax=Streptomyces sp. NPDC057682 TaxID=3346210 RepID=UPI0036C521CD